MGRELEEITPELTEFLEAQPVFFVATAPESPNHHVNVSPKGLDSFRVLDADTAAYLDLHGSGIETVAHVRENGRITLDYVGERTELTDWAAKHGDEGLAEYRIKKNATSISGLPGWS